MESRTRGEGGSWVFIIIQDHPPPMGGGVQGLWDFPETPPKHLLQNWKLLEFPQFPLCKTRVFSYAAHEYPDFYERNIPKKDFDLIVYNHEYTFIIVKL